ncbi:hypothetical protein [Roseibium aggregatum]|uniref:Uncharacterized protein n=1 Tax=Roseibium aggregatum TaxID=187304 RepID=A0A0M6Y9K3_9HYPH|nr:hypothetical protein [Roseibium aggregatum]CTQ45681.1 hypothetical protein LAL4801_04136 [Roseibium aggregatum]
MSWDLNLNNAEAPSNDYELVPHGTFAKIKVNIRLAEDAGKRHPNDPHVTVNPATGSCYLDMVYTITGTIDGKWVNKKIFDKIGIKSSNEKIQQNRGEDKWAKMGFGMIRSIVESARGINPKDTTPEANMKRDISQGGFANLQDLEIVGRITVDTKNVDAQGNPNPQNRLGSAITIDRKEYSALMSGAPTGGGAAMGGGSAPAWANQGGQQAQPQQQNFGGQQQFQQPAQQQQFQPQEQQAQQYQPQPQQQQQPDQNFQPPQTGAWGGAPAQQPAQNAGGWMN